MFQKSLTACGSVCDMRLFDKGVRHETRRFVIAPSFVGRACDFWGWLGPSQLFLSVYFLFIFERLLFVFLGVGEVSPCASMYSGLRPCAHTPRPPLSVEWNVESGAWEGKNPNTKIPPPTPPQGQANMTHQASTTS